MTSSSFQCFPGLQILHSTDLVNWEIIGAALLDDYPVLPEYQGTELDWRKKVQHGNYVWAPSIRYHDGWFYIYCGDPDQGLFMTKTQDPRGPWEPITWVMKGKGLIDCCPLWDEDGKAYLSHGCAGSRAGIKSVLFVAPMSPDGTKVIGPSRIVYDGHENQPTIEGTKFYKRNGYYYIMSPAGGVKYGWQVELRSKNPYAVILILTIAWILLSTQTLQYPVSRLFLGLNYYRYPGVTFLLIYIVMALAAFIPFLGMLHPHSSALQKWQKSKWVMVASYVIVLFASVWGIRTSFDELTYEMIDYDFWIRTEQWNKIIEHAEKKPATSPLGVSSVNLALSQTGQLPDRLFEFYQNGAEGLFPAFTRDMTSPVSTSEVFYRLGMVNDAERYMFEAQEAIPNFRKSARLTRRIAECEIINGNYEVAAKLLRRLQKTIFYSNWANQTMALLGNEKAINRHPVYGKLRKYREKKQDFLFSDREMDQMLGLLFLNDKSNKMAYEYLMCYVLLQRDFNKFMQYYPLGRFVGYDHIPRSFQEILIEQWMKTHNDPRTIPYSVDAQNVNNTLNFIQIYLRNPKDPQLSQQPYISNAWHYMVVQGADEASKKKEEKKTIY